MKNYYLLAITCAFSALQAYNIPKFYHGKIFQDEPHFAESKLTSFDLTVAGGHKRFQYRGYTGTLNMTELYAQFYQNFDKGLFLHAYVPFCWVKMNDLEQVHLHDHPLPSNVHKTDIYSPTILFGWTMNYEGTTYLDYIDVTLEAGAILNTPRNAITVPLFPVGYTTDPGFAWAGYSAFGAYEWLTLGFYGQALSYHPATIWSTGAYLKFDHLIPKLSLTFAFCGDGQNKIIELIDPWQMASFYFSFEVDLATDEHPWLPRLKALFTKPFAGFGILKTSLAGFNIAIDLGGDF